VVGVQCCVTTGENATSFLAFISAPCIVLRIRVLRLGSKTGKARRWRCRDSISCRRCSAILRQRPFSCCHPRYDPPLHTPHDSRINFGTSVFVLGVGGAGARRVGGPLPRGKGLRLMRPGNRLGEGGLVTIDSVMDDLDYMVDTPFVS
jgi:hypothetical protein